MPNMIRVESSSVRAIGYDDATQRLHIQYRTGTHYIYYGVPRRVFDELLTAPSKGSFVNRQVKNVYRVAKKR
jgi:hypothetical protein